MPTNELWPVKNIITYKKLASKLYICKNRIWHWITYKDWSALKQNQIIYIVIHKQTVSFYENSSVWLDTQDARNRNPSNFTIDYVSDHSATKRITLATGIFKVFIFSKQQQQQQQQQQQPLFTFFIPYRLPECSILSKSFALRLRWPTIPSPESSNI